MKKYKLLAFIIAVLFVFSVFPFNTVYAVENTENTYEPDTYIPEEEYTEEIYEGTGSLEYAFDGTFIRDYVDNETLDEAGHVARINEEEELNTYVFLNRDGTKSVYYMDDNVRYVDENGETVEKDLTIIRKNKGYTLKANDVKLWFPDVLSDGISVKYDKYHLTLYPQGVADTEEVIIDEYERITYPGVFGENTVLAYTPTLSGLKEDIILSEYTGQLSYDFLIHTHGMRILEEEGKYIVKKPGNGNKETFELGAVQIYDSAGNFCVGEMKITEQNNGSKYILTLIAPEEFLTDPDTVYPVTIDPTLEVSDNLNGANAIEDSVIYSGTPNSNYGGFTYLTVGYGDSTYGVGRAVFRLSALNTNEAFLASTADNILSATFHTWDGTGTTGRTVNLYALGSYMWTESGITWNNCPSHTGTIMSSASLPGAAYSTFDITNLVKQWRTGTSAHFGFILINPDETNSANKKVPCSSETAVTNRRPYVVMTYTGSVDVSAQTTYLLVGGTKQVTCTTNPTGLTVSWNSSNTSVATVSSSGLVTGISEGTVTITATYTDTVTGISSYDYVVLTVVDSLGIKDDTEYYIMNYSSKRYLSLETATDTSMTNVYTRLRDTSDLSKWTTEKQSDGTYQLISVYSSTGKALDVTGTNIDIYTDNNASYQKFTIYRINSGAYQGLYYIRYGNYFVAQDSDYNVYLTTTASSSAVWSFMAVEKRGAKLFCHNYPYVDENGDDRIFNTSTNSSLFSTNMTQAAYTAQVYINPTSESAYASLRTDDIFVFMGHGNAGLVAFYDSTGTRLGRIFAHTNMGNHLPAPFYVNNLNYNELCLNRCVVFLGCNTGLDAERSSGTYNLIDETFGKGAHFALGTTEKLYTTQINNWFQYFLNAISDGLSISEAMNRADRELGTINVPYDKEDGSEGHRTVYGLPSYYVGDSSQYLH